MIFSLFSLCKYLYSFAWFFEKQISLFFQKIQTAILQEWTTEIKNYIKMN